jgi:hypothetical protein
MSDTTSTTPLADALAAADAETENHYGGLLELAEAVREHLASLSATAPPKPGITRVNSLFTVFAVLPADNSDAWYVAGVQDDGQHWATWYSEADDAGLLSYYDGNLFGSREAALTDLRMAGVRKYLAEFSEQDTAALAVTAVELFDNADTDTLADLSMRQAEIVGKARKIYGEQ